MSDRFVILHHRLDDSEHWDLMLEYGDSLLTWQLPGDPTRPDSLPMTARRIAGHRKAYLHYEGPISDNRGTVMRICCGSVWIEEINALRCRFRIESNQWNGQLELVCRSGADWTLRSIQDPLLPRPTG